MSGHWPPEWEDQEEEFPEGAEQLDAEAQARLSEVAAYLASVPVPVMPDAVEARISAALVAEAATRTGHAAPADAARTLDRKRRRPRLRRNRGGGPRRWQPALAGGSLVIVLLVGLGFALSLGSSSSSSSSEASAAGSSISSSKAVGSNAEGRPGPRSAAPFEPAEGRASTATGSVPTPASSSSSSFSATGSAPAPASSSSSSSSSAPAPTLPTASVSYVVTASGTKYQTATLASQVRARLNAPGGSGARPGTALLGCVSQLTGGQSPRLVDKATYQGSPAYIIATSSKVWVVGLGCTAANTDLITSVPLAGLPGNLRALVSVEQYRRTSSI